ncbi:hypothetical protein JCM5350_006567 [Sporobolomyces pararoseus]
MDLNDSPFANFNGSERRIAKIFHRLIILHLNLGLLPPHLPDRPTQYLNLFNKYIQVAARATRQALKEEERLAAEKRGVVTLKYQQWSQGKPSTAEWIVPPAEAQH